MAARRILTLAVYGALIASVHASPRTDPTQGRAVFTGAATASPTSVGLSPAAIGLVQVTQLYVALASKLVQTAIDLRDPATSVDDTTPAPGGAFALVGRPGQSDRIRLGFEIHVPPPERALAGYDELKYFTRGGYHAIASQTFAVSIKVSGSFFVGAALSHENAWLRLRYARDAALANGNGPGGVGSDCAGAPCGIGNPDATEYYDVKARASYISASNLKVTLGMIVKLAPDVWLGAAYHTPPGISLQTELDGRIRSRQATRDGSAEVINDAVVTFSQPASVDVQLRARVLDDLEANLGGRWEDTSRFSAYDVRGFGSTYAGNGFPEVQLRPRGLHDSFAVWGGVEQIDHGERLRLGGRIGFESAGLRDERNAPTTIWPRSFTVDAGAQLRLFPDLPLVMQLTYGLQYFPDVDTGTGAFDAQDRIDCIDSGFDYSTPACAATRNGYAIGNSAGTYGKLEHAARIGFRYDWF